MRTFLFLVIFLCVASAAFAQPNPTTVWQRTLDTGADEISAAIQTTSDSGLIAVGEVDYANGDIDGYVVRLNGSGDTLWTRLFPGEGRLALSDVRQTADGGFILAGTTLTASEGNNAILMRMDAAGDTLWTRLYGGSRDDQAVAVRALPDGYVFAGSSSSYGEEGSDFWIVRISLDGDTLWTRNYGGEQDQLAWNMEIASDGGFVVCGYTGPPFSNAVDALVVKFDAEGYVLWSRIYGDSADSTDLATAVVQTPEDGGYLISCITSSRGAGRYDTWLIKTTRSGDSLWTRTIGSLNFEEVFDLKRVPGGYVLFGSWINMGQSGANMYLMRVDTMGNLRWTQRYGGFSIALGTSLCVLEDGGYGLVGYRTGINEQNWNLQVIRTGPDRTLPAKDRGLSVPEAVSLTSYPNPFNPTTVLRLVLVQESEITLRIFDLNGREVETLATRQTLWTGEHRFLFDGTGFPSGVYLARVDGPGFSAAQKLLLIR